jgi:hypothetical protein
VTAECQKPAFGNLLFQKTVKVLMMTDVNLAPVIQPGPFQVAIVHLETQRVYQMKA